MSTPRLYKKVNPNAPKRVMMELMEDPDGEGHLILAAVDTQGNIVAELIHFYPEDAVAWPNAKDDLEEQGYDTSFAKWDDGGYIVLEKG